jgi:leucyl aminopeptidase
MKFIVEKGLNKAQFTKRDAVLLPIWLPHNKPAMPGEVFAVFSTTDRAFLKKWMKVHEVKAGEFSVLKLVSGNFVIIAAEEKWTEKKFALLVRKIIRRAKQDGFKTLGVYIDDFEQDNISAVRAGELTAENALMAHFDFAEEFKSRPKGGWKKVENVSIFTLADIKQVTAAVKTGELIGEAVNRSRVLANYPPGDMKPDGLVEAALTVAGEVPEVAVTVFDEHRLKAEGMNAILAVGQGSVCPPRLIMMEYKNGDPKEKPVALIGKGVTFDSGGLNIKPGDSMADMHMDMSGGAAVVSAMWAIAKLKLPVNVIGLVPAVENMPSGISYRQGDIIKAYGGKTIEIGNTDAEGRVILADAIEYAKTKKPAVIITLATLTGAAMSALGLRMSALFVKDNKPFEDKLREIGDASGDLVWPMPLWEEHEADVVGNFADVTNTSKTNSRYGGALAGAAFLSHFAKGANFAHIDMAPRMTTIPEDELARGSAGYGVRYFVALCKKWAEVQKLLK